MADLRYLLAIYVHAHQTGNSVPPHIDAEARAALAAAPESAVKQSLTTAPPAPLEGEVGELVAEIRHFLAGYRKMRGLDPEYVYSIHRGDAMEAHIRVSRLSRAAELLQRLSPPQPVPVSVSDALIKAECALSDIAEGEPMTDEGDPLQWAERRCADTLAIIRPTMRQHKIRTSEWPPLPRGR